MSKTYAVVAIENNVVVDQQWSLTKHEFPIVVKMWRSRLPFATLAVENSHGRIEQTFGPSK